MDLILPHLPLTLAVGALHQDLNPTSADIQQPRPTNTARLLANDRIRDRHRSGMSASAAPLVRWRCFPRLHARPSERRYPDIREKRDTLG